MNWFKKIFRKNKAIKNRKVSKARFLFLYVIFGGISGVLYAITAVVLDYPIHWAFTPVYLLGAYIVYRFGLKNWRLIWLFISDMEQGRLLMFMNKFTQFEEDHKLKVLNWVYLKRNTVRSETRAKIIKKLLDKNTELTLEEKILIKRKEVFCPQQLKDGFSEAMFVNTLIYAHNNIQVLDDDLREIMNLTDANMLAFDLKKEYDKAGGDEIQRLMDIGMKASEKLNK